MKVIAVEKEVSGVREEQFTAELLQAEARKAWDLYQSGILRELHFREDRNAAVLVLECAGPREARDALAQLPLVRAGLIDFELIPLKPYLGFERLFSAAGRQ